MKLLRAGWSAYRTAMMNYPLRTNVLTSGVSMSIGDGVAQSLELKHSGTALSWSSLDLTRTAVAIGWNSLIFTPLFFVWFKRLDTWFPGTSPMTVFKKVVFNQMVVAVPINGGFLAYTTLVEQVLNHGAQSVSSAGSEIATRVETQLLEDVPGLFLRSTFLWIPVNTLNFLWVSPTFRVIPTILCSTVWSVYLSLTAHKRGEIVLVEEQRK